MRVPVSWLPIAALAIAAGCATPATWQRPDTPPDQVAFDLQGCRSRARAQMDSDLYYARERAYLDAQRAEAIGRTGTAVLDRWQEDRERDDFDALVGDCMTRKGYRLLPAARGGRSA